MPRKRVWQPIPFPLRGYLYTPSTLMADKAFCPVVSGVRFSRGEALAQAKFLGFGDGPVNTGVSTLDNIPLELGIYEKADLTFAAVIGTKTKIYKYNGAGGFDEWVDITGGAVFTGTDFSPWAFANALDTLCMSNGGNGIYQWNGAGNISSLTAAVAGRYLESFAGRLMVANVYDGATRADRVQWCGYLNLANWNAGLDPTAGALDLTDIPGPITGMRNLGATLLLVYKRNAIFRMAETGLISPAFALQIAHNGIGTIAGRSVVSIGGRHFFLGEDNVYVYDGSSQPQPIGTQIRDEVFSSLNNDKLRQVFAFHHQQQGEYWLCLPTGGTDWPTLAFVYNYIDNTWWRTPIDLTCAGVARRGVIGDAWGDITETWANYTRSWDSPLTGAEANFPIFGRSNRHTYRFDEANYESATIDQSYLNWFDTADDQLGLPGIYKTVDRVMLTGRVLSRSAIKVEISTDGGVTFPSSGTATWPAVTDTRVIAQIIIPVPRISGDYFRIRISSSGSFRLAAMAMEVLNRETEVR